MTQGDYVSFFEKFFDLKGLTDKDRNDINALVTEKNFNKDELIFNEGDPGDSLLFVKSGIVRIYITDLKEEKTITLVKQGEIFGEIALFDNGTRSAQSKALIESSILVITKENLTKLEDKNPILALKIINKILQIFSKRLRGTTRKMYGIY